MEELDYLLPDDYEEEAEETTEAETEEATEEEVEVDDTNEEEAEEVTEDTTEETETEEAEEVTETAKLEDLEIKFLKETKKLSEYEPDEIKELVQLGLNNERFDEKYNALQTEKESLQTEYDEVIDIAKLHGLDVGQLKEALLSEYFKAQSNPELAKKEYEISKTDRASKKQEAKDRDLKTFVERFPDAKSDDISAETWAKNKEGIPLAEAYQQQLYAEKAEALESKVAELEKQLKTKRTNEANKKKAPVKSTTGKGTGDIKEDDFLSGLLG